MEVDCVAALSLPSTMTDSANVASATEGAAPNKPAKLFGLKRSPRSAKVETDIPPMMKRIRISFIMPRQNYSCTLQSLSLKTARHHQARRVWTNIAAKELFIPPSCGADGCRNTAITGSSNPVPQDINRTNPDKRDRFESDERSPERKGDLQAQLDELGDDPAQVGVDSAGQTVSSQGLSEVRDADEESVEELSDADQAIEAAAVEGVEDAADHPERPTHTHEEYSNREDVPPRRRDDAA
jgi:hypothetical protein